jgi:hypothetical protein
MTNGQGGHSRDRRIFLGATAALLGLPNISSRSRNRLTRWPRKGAELFQTQCLRRDQDRGFRPHGDHRGPAAARGSKACCARQWCLRSRHGFDLSIWPSSRLPR